MQTYKAKFNIQFFFSSITSIKYIKIQISYHFLNYNYAKQTP